MAASIKLSENFSHTEIFLNVIEKTVNIGIVKFSLLTT